MQNQITRHLRCVLNNTELLEISKQSAELTRGIVALEEDKARISKDFAARISEKVSARSILTDKVLTGYEFRDVTCTVNLDTPAPGSKTVVRNDTGEQVAIEQMTPDEMQGELPLEPDDQPGFPPHVPENAENAEPAAALENTDDQVDETAASDLLNYHVSRDEFRNALDGANLATLREADRRFAGKGKRRQLLQDQIQKLEEANGKTETTVDGYIWDTDGLCQNPISLTVIGPRLIEFAISAARAPSGMFRRGLAISNCEPDPGDLCDLGGDEFETAQSAYEAALNDVLAFFEAGKAHGVKEQASSAKALQAKGVRQQIILAATDAIMAGKSATLDLTK